jgi:[acyl-carrier-protein] S-malonyltransferase
MARKLSMVFPGQGSQTVGMLNEMAAKFPIVQKTFSESSQILGYDVWELASKGPKEKLDETEFTQSVMLAANVALWRCWIEKNGSKPEVLAGHSLGEYCALVCAESIKFEDAVSLVALRGKHMQNAVPVGQGAMGAIIGLDDNAVKNLCEEAAQGEALSPANFNSIGQVVIAGTTAAVNRAIAMAKARKVKVATLLPVSIPSHCPLMQPAADKMKEALEKITITSPKIPVIHNFDVTTHSDPNEIRNVLVQQLVSPVRWVETVKEMEKIGVTDLIECGPGKVLFGSTKWISRTIVAYSINPPNLFEDNLVLLKTLLK